MGWLELAATTYLLKLCLGRKPNGTVSRDMVSWQRSRRSTNMMICFRTLWLLLKLELLEFGLVLMTGLQKMNSDGLIVANIYSLPNGTPMNRQIRKMMIVSS